METTGRSIHLERPTRLSNHAGFHSHPENSWLRIRAFDRPPTSLWLTRQLPVSRRLPASAQQTAGGEAPLQLFARDRTLADQSIQRRLALRSARRLDDVPPVFTVENEFRLRFQPTEVGGRIQLRAQRTM